jgi:predicted RNA-binding protein (virulence factor B family)
MKTEIYEEIIKAMPPGLKRDILRILEGSNQKDRITKEKLAYCMNLKYSDALDRQIRATVEELRNEGFPIVSDSGHAGYYFASNLKEIESLTQELESRSKKMLEQSRMMKRRALELFGAQQALF